MKKFIIVVLVLSFFGSHTFADKCYEVLTTQDSLCGVKIEKLNEVNEICFTSTDNYRTSFHINNSKFFQVVAGFDWSGEVFGDGGTRSYGEEDFFTRPVVSTPNEGIIIKNEDSCMIYLNRDYNSYWMNHPRVLKFHVCEGNIFNRRNHPEKRCGATN